MIEENASNGPGKKHRILVSAQRLGWAELRVSHCAQQRGEGRKAAVRFHPLGLILSCCLGDKGQKAMIKTCLGWEILLWK